MCASKACTLKWRPRLSPSLISLYSEAQSILFLSQLPKGCGCQRTKRHRNSERDWGGERGSVCVRHRENVSTICIGCIQWNDRICSPGRLRNGTSHCGKAEEWTGSPPAAPDSQAFFPDKVAPPTHPPEASWHYDMGLGPCQLPLRPVAKLG